MFRWAIDYSPFDGSELARPTQSTDGGKTWHATPRTSGPGAARPMCSMPTTKILIEL